MVWSRGFAHRTSGDITQLFPAIHSFLEFIRLVNVYSADIGAFPEYTSVFYKIFAENNIGKTSSIDRVYSVIPEFPSWAPVLFLTIILTVTAVIFKRKLKKQ